MSMDANLWGWNPEEASKIFDGLDFNQEFFQGTPSVLSASFNPPEDSFVAREKLPDMQQPNVSISDITQPSFRQTPQPRIRSDTVLSKPKLDNITDDIESYLPQKLHEHPADLPQGEKEDLNIGPVPKAGPLMTPVPQRPQSVSFLQKRPQVNDSMNSPRTNPSSVLQQGPLTTKRLEPCKSLTVTEETQNLHKTKIMNTNHTSFVQQQKYNQSTNPRNGYNASTAYPVLPTVLKEWNIFRYNSWGELEPGMSYSASDIERYLFKHPLHKATADGNLQTSRLRLWIQRVPQNSIQRCGNPHSLLCRFRACRFKDNFIQGDSRRVVFDEQSHKSDRVNPLHNAGYVHLRCLEEFLDFPKICAKLNIRPEDRKLPYEPYGMNGMLLTIHEYEYSNMFINFCRQHDRAPSYYASIHLPARSYDRTLAGELSCKSKIPIPPHVNGQKQVSKPQRSYVHDAGNSKQVSGTSHLAGEKNGKPSGSEFSLVLETYSEEERARKFANQRTQLRESRARYKSKKRAAELEPENLRRRPAKRRYESSSEEEKGAPEVELERPRRRPTKRRYESSSEEESEEEIVVKRSKRNRRN